MRYKDGEAKIRIGRMKVSIKKDTNTIKELFGSDNIDLSVKELLIRFGSMRYAEGFLDAKDKNSVVEDLHGISSDLYWKIIDAVKTGKQKRALLSKGD